MNTPTQATHTAGPWFAGDGTNSSEEGTIYCDSEMRSAVGFACGSSRARKIANARLFAAAPELLEALQRAVRSRWLSIDHEWNRSPEGAEIRNLMCAAIDRATGATP